VVDVVDEHAADGAREEVRAQLEARGRRRGSAAAARGGCRRGRVVWQRRDGGLHAYADCGG
jgi:hypothetical protein